MVADVVAALYSKKVNEITQLLKKQQSKIKQDQYSIIKKKPH